MERADAATDLLASVPATTIGVEVSDAAAVSRAGATSPAADRLDADWLGSNMKVKLRTLPAPGQVKLTASRRMG